MEMSMWQLMSRRSLALITGIIAITTGYFYGFGFEYIEQEAREWGRWVMIAGMCSILAGWLPLRRQLIRIAVIVGYSILILAQILPIIFWLALVPISDDPEGVIASRLYVAPHVLIVICCLATIIRISKEPIDAPNHAA